MFATFAPITEEFDLQFARTLPPIAHSLWKWLRRQGRPETLIEFRLTDFVEAFDYSLKWGRQAISTLVEAGLLEIDLKAHDSWYRVKVFQIGDIGKKTSSIEKETSNFGDKTSQKQASNPHHPVPLNKENIEIKQNPENPTTHPVLNEQEMVPEALEFGQDAEYEELFQEIEQAGIILNPTLRTLTGTLRN